MIALHPDGVQRHHGEWRVSPSDDPSNLRELKSAPALMTQVDRRTPGCKTWQDIRYQKGWHSAECRERVLRGRGEGCGGCGSYTGLRRKDSVVQPSNAVNCGHVPVQMTLNNPHEAGGRERFSGTSSFSSSSSHWKVAGPLAPCIGLGPGEMLIRPHPAVESLHARLVLSTTRRGAPAAT